MSDPILPALNSSSTSRLADTSPHTKDASGKAIISNRAFIIIWRVLIIIAVIIGVALDAGSLSGFFVRLVFFTIQSNIMLAICLGWAALAILRKAAGPAPLLKGAVTVYISITGLVFNLILAKVVGPPVPGSIIVPVIGGSLGNDLLHKLTPIMAVLDWLFFDIHGRFHWQYALRWLTYPLVYLAYILIRGVLVRGPYSYPNVHYPYPFLDVTHIGYSGVAINTVIYGVAFWLIGLIFVAVDRGLGHRIR